MDRRSFMKLAAGSPVLVSGVYGERSNNSLDGGGESVCRWPLVARLPDGFHLLLSSG